MIEITPKIVAIDTSTTTLSVALSLPSGRILKKNYPDLKKHAELLLPAIQELLKDADLSLDKLDAIAVVVGPGSFTGLRVGIVAAQALAYSLGIKVVPITSLEAMAYSAYQAHKKNSILCGLDARMNEVYLGKYLYSDETQQLEEISLEVIKPELVEIDDDVDVCVGNGFSVYKNIFKGLSVANVDAEIMPLAENVLSIVLNKISQEKIEFIDPIELHAMYVRNKVVN